MLYSTARFIVEFFRDHEQGNLFGRPARHLAVDLARTDRRWSADHHGVAELCARWYRNPDEGLR